MAKKKTVKFITCANCSIKFEDTDLGAWSRIILKQQPACSYECNKALGQVK